MKNFIKFFGTSVLSLKSNFITTMTSQSLSRCIIVDLNSKLLHMSSHFNACDWDWDCGCVRALTVCKGIWSLLTTQLASMFIFIFIFLLFFFCVDYVRSTVAVVVVVGDGVIESCKHHDTQFSWIYSILRVKCYSVSLLTYLLFSFLSTFVVKRFLFAPSGTEPFTSLHKWTSKQ